MALLLLGLALFFAAHLFPRLRAQRAAVIERFGEGPYKGAFSVVSISALVMIVLGYQDDAWLASDDFYTPNPERGRAVAHALMPFAFILVAGANMKSNLKRFVRHPMSWGVLLWSASHLSANGELRSVILFGAFGVFAALSMILTSAAGSTPPPPQQPQRKDLILIAAGLVAYVGVIWAHTVVFDVPVAG